VSRPLRNLIIFSVASLSGGFVGIALDQLAPPANRMEGLGVLVWLVTPLLTNILLRAFGGDGWQDLGWQLHLRSSWVWYGVALFSLPLVMGVVLGLGALSGALDTAGLAARGWGPYLALAGAAFGGALVKNIFEEFAWRGYLTPRFAELQLRPWMAYLLTGFIWAGWHVPYYLYFLDPLVLQSHTPLPLPAFMAVAFVLLPFHALTYGELRLLSGSTWPAWLLHTVANALSLPLLSDGFVTLRGGAGVLLSPGTEGILFTLLFALIGVGLYQYRTRSVGRRQRAAAAPAPVGG